MPPGGQPIIMQPRSSRDPVDQSLYGTNLHCKSTFDACLEPVPLARHMIPYPSLKFGTQVVASSRCS